MVAMAWVILCAPTSHSDNTRGKNCFKDWCESNLGFSIEWDEGIPYIKHVNSDVIQPCRAVLPCRMQYAAMPAGRCNRIKPDSGSWLAQGLNDKAKNIHRIKQFNKLTLIIIKKMSDDEDDFCHWAKTRGPGLLKPGQCGSVLIPLGMAPKSPGSPQLTLTFSEKNKKAIFSGVFPGLTQFMIHSL